MLTSMSTFWQLLTDEERLALSRTGRVLDFAPGQPVIREMDRERWIGVLLGGQARVLVGPADRVIAIRRVGDVVGELAMIDSNPRSATVEAATRVRALVLSADQYRSVVEVRPRIMLLVLRVVAQRLREADRRRGDDGQHLRTRFASLLVEYVDDYGIPDQQGIFVPITSQADVASVVRASRGSLAKVLSQLRRQRVLSTVRGAFVVHDPDTLRDLATSR